MFCGEKQRTSSDKSYQEMNETSARRRSRDLAIAVYDRQLFGRERLRDAAYCCYNETFECRVGQMIGLWYTGALLGIHTFFWGCRRRNPTTAPMFG